MHGRGHTKEPNFATAAGVVQKKSSTPSRPEPLDLCRRCKVMHQKL